MRRATLIPFAKVMAAGIALVLLTLAMSLTAFAQGPEGGVTAMTVEAPVSAGLGERVVLRAHLADSSGAPIAKATVLFVTPATFLSATGDAVATEAVTDTAGLAVANYEPRSVGQITLRAEFRGDDRYAPSSASVQMAAVGDRQVYTEQTGVRIPGWNAAPSLGPQMEIDSTALAYQPTLGLSDLLVGVRGWPIAGVLLLVWSLYAFVVVLVYRVAMAGARGMASPLLALGWEDQLRVDAEEAEFESAPDATRPAARQVGVAQ